MLSTTGAEYMGGAQRGGRGQACQSWTRTPLPDYYLSAILNASIVLHGIEAANVGAQCRNVDYDPQGPWCYGSEQQRLYCDIVHCG